MIYVLVCRVRFQWWKQQFKWNRILIEKIKPKHDALPSFSMICCAILPTLFEDKAPFVGDNWLAFRRSLSWGFAEGSSCTNANAREYVHNSRFHFITTQLTWHSGKFGRCPETRTGAGGAATLAQSFFFLAQFPTSHTTVGMDSPLRDKIHYDYLTSVSTTCKLLIACSLDRNYSFKYFATVTRL